MKDQAKELMRQVEAFKTGQSDSHQAPARAQASVARPAAKPTSASVKREALSVKRAGSASGTNDASRDTSRANKEPVGVGHGLPAAMQAGNGKDRRRKDEEFEEF
jgi:hypothetical protein